MRTSTHTIAIVLLLTGSYAIAEDYPEPGLYEVEATISSDQLPVNRTHQSRQCINDDQYRRDPKTWLQQQQGQECEIVKYDMSGGNIHMELKCMVEGSGASTIIGNGTYNSNSYRMENDMTMSAGGMNMQIKTVVTGTRSGDC